MAEDVTPLSTCERPDDVRVPCISGTFVIRTCFSAQDIDTEMHGRARLKHLSVDDAEQCS